MKNPTIKGCVCTEFGKLFPAIETAAKFSALS